MVKEKEKNRQKEILAEEEKTKELAARYHVPYLDLSSVSINRELVQSFPVDFLYRSLFVPLDDEGQRVKIAIADPSDLATIDAIESYLGKKVEVYAASREEFMKPCAKVRRLFKSSAMLPKALLPKLSRKKRRKLRTLSQ